MPSITTTDAGLDLMAPNLFALFEDILAEPGAYLLAERDGELFIERVH